MYPKSHSSEFTRYCIILIIKMPDLLKSDYCRRLKGSLIGSNRQKHLIVERGILPRLISLLGNSESQSELQVAIAQTLGSVAKGMETHLKALIDCGVVPVLLNGLLRSNNKKLTEASLCCLKTIFVHPEVNTMQLKI